MTTILTNGCFDVLHIGHIHLLQQARALGDRLIVALNSDKSIRSIKGEGRPINNERDRRDVLLALRCVDDVIVFDDDTPERLIQIVRPDVLVKGSDWQGKKVAGSEYAGELVFIPLLAGYSTTSILERARQ